MGKIFYLSDDKYDFLDQLAQNQKLTVDQLVDRIIENFIGQGIDGAKLSLSTEKQSFQFKSENERTLSHDDAKEIFDIGLNIQKNLSGIFRVCLRAKSKR